MKTCIPIQGIPLYEAGHIDTGYYTTVYLGNYISGDYNENVGSHCGVDIDAAKYPGGHTNVLAAMDGVVIKAQTGDPSYGNYVVIQHDNCVSATNPSATTTYYSCYLHLDSLNVVAGQTVVAGYAIGISGSTGNSTSPHLHFQIDCADAPFHPYWPFTSAEAAAAGYSFTDATNHGLNMDKAALYTINPLVYLHDHAEETPATTSIFSDVPDTDADYAAIKYFKDHGVIEGYSDGSFKPENPINRAEILKLAFKAFNVATHSYSVSSFPDVPTTAWYFPYVETAKQEGLIDGNPDGTFKPGNHVTRAEALKILLNTAKKSISGSDSVTRFSDVAVTEWYIKYVNTAYDQNYIDRTSTFSPNVDCARRYVVRWGYRMI